MEENKYPLGMIVGNMLRPMFQLYKRSFNESESPLTFDQFRLLHGIHIKKEDVVQQDMAEMLAKDKSAILRIIDSLEKKNLLERNPDPNDRRKNILTVTPEGLEVLTHFQQIATALNMHFIEGISEEDIETFIAVAKKIQRNAEKMM